MKAVAVTSPGQIEIVDVPMPQPRGYECLVKVEASGLCNSTDLKIINNEISTFTVRYPVILGHEGVGRIVETGSKVRNLRVGQRFLNPIGRIEPGTPFTPMWASMVEYAVLQDHQVMREMSIGRPGFDGGAARPIPDSISPEDAGVLLTLKECYSGVRNLGFRAGMDVLVYGDGPIGLGLVSFMRMGGAGWIGCVGHRGHRLQHILSHGRPDLIIDATQEDVVQKLGDRRFDLVIDAVGSIAIIKQAAARLKPGGKVGVYGVLKKKDSQLCLLDLPNNVVLHMLNFPYQEHAVHDEIVQMALDGRLNPKDYYSHVLPLDQAGRAVELVRSREAFKVVLKT